MGSSGFLGPMSPCGNHRRPSFAHTVLPAISSGDTVGRLRICPNEVLITFHSSLSSVLYENAFLSELFALSTVLTKLCCKLLNVDETRRPAELDMWGERGMW